MTEQEPTPQVQTPPVDPAAQLETPQAKPARERDEKGRLLPKREEKATWDKWKDRLQGQVKPEDQPITAGTEQPQDAKAKADAPAGEATGEPEVDKEAHAAALANARRLKIPAKALEAMSKAEIVQAGQDWAKQVSDNGKLSRELGELREQAKAREASKESAPSKDAQPDDDLDALLQPFIADYDEDTKKSLGGIAKALEARHKSDLEKIRAELGTYAEERTQRLVNEAKDKLKERFPGLGEEENEQRVLKRMASLNKTGDYNTYADLMRDACLIELPPAVSASQSQPSASANKRNSVARTDTQGSRSSAPAKSDKARETYFKHFQGGARTG